MKKPLASFVERSTYASRDPKGHVGAHDVGSVRLAMAGVVHTSPGYTRDELEQDARRILEYLQPALHPDAQRMAGTDADMRLLPVQPQHVVHAFAQLRFSGLKTRHSSILVHVCRLEQRV